MIEPLRLVSGEALQPLSYPNRDSKSCQCQLLRLADILCCLLCWVPTELERCEWHEKCIHRPEWCSHHKQQTPVEKWKISFVLVWLASVTRLQFELVLGHYSHTIAPSTVINRTKLNLNQLDRHACYKVTCYVLIKFWLRCMFQREWPACDVALNSPSQASKSHLWAVVQWLQFWTGFSSTHIKA